MPDRNVEGNAEPTAIDAWFDALSDPRRRCLCRYLIRTEPDVVTHDDLVEFVIERDPTVADDVSDRQSVAMELRHVHLPKLNALEPVDYDPNGGRVSTDSETLATRLEAVRSTIDAMLAERNC